MKADRFVNKNEAQSDEIWGTYIAACENLKNECIVEDTLANRSVVKSNDLAEEKENCHKPDCE